MKETHVPLTIHVPASIKRNLETATRRAGTSIDQWMLRLINRSLARKAPQYKYEVPAITNHQDIQTLLANTQDERVYLIVSLAYYVGITSGELSLLRWDDFTATGNKYEIHITGVYRNRNRTVAIPEHLWKRLVEYRNTLPDEVDFFLATRLHHGGPLSRRSIGRILQNSRESLGLPASVTIQRLRNSHVQYMLDQGASLAEVQANLGHITTKTTARHLNPQHLQITSLTQKT